MNSTVSTTQGHEPDSRHSVLAVAAGAVGATAAVLLAAGCILSHNALLAMGIVAIVVTVGLTCLLAIRHMVESAAEAAVRRAVAQVRAVMAEQIEAAVTTTAVRVGDAIAESLREPEPDDMWLGDGDGPGPRAVPTPIYTR